MPGWLWVFLGCSLVILVGIFGMIWAGSYLRKVERKQHEEKHNHAKNH